jgi:hypothetical protein
MPNMPGTVTKTKTFTAMDKIWSSDPAKRLTEYKNAADIKSLLADAVTNNWISQPVADHVTKHWLDAYWPSAQAQDVLHRGLYWAMRVAVYTNAGEATEKVRPSPLPICCAWICSGGKAKKGRARFEVISIESDSQVTLLLLTPPPEGLWGDEPIGPYQRIWATRRSDFGKDNGEHLIETWKTTLTVRPHDYEDYQAPAPK